LNKGSEKTEVQKIQKGLTGIASKYEHDKKNEELKKE
jgi:hypothetical protein